jgi:hypothetical protein
VIVISLYFFVSSLYPSSYINCGSLLDSLTLLTLQWFFGCLCHLLALCIMHFLETHLFCLGNNPLVLVLVQSLYNLVEQEIQFLADVLLILCTMYFFWCLTTVYNQIFVASLHAHQKPLFGQRLNFVLKLWARLI